VQTSVEDWKTIVHSSPVLQLFFSSQKAVVHSEPGFSCQSSDAWLQWSDQIGVNQKILLAAVGNVAVVAGTVAIAAEAAVVVPDVPVEIGWATS